VAVGVLAGGLLLGWALAGTPLRSAPGRSATPAVGTGPAVSASSSAPSSTTVPESSGSPTPSAARSQVRSAPAARSPGAPAPHPAAPPGPAQVPTRPAAPCTGAALQPGDVVQAAVDAHPAGTTFCLAAGIYRLPATIDPKAGDVFVGAPGAVLSGARVVTDFARSGGWWVLPNQTQASAPSGDPGVECDSTHPRCVDNEGVFVDDQALTAVASLSALGPGKFYFDHAGHAIYLADNPTGHRVEASVTSLAFYSSHYVTGVQVRGLVIEKFANPASEGALTGGAGWVADGNEVRLNHGAGICMFPNDPGTGNWVVSNNHVHHNGQMGLCGQQVSGLVENNEIDHNNTAGFWYGWEAGGAKWVHTTGLVVRGNYVHDNAGIGLWTDGYNVNTLYEGNRVENNTASGIQQEISYNAIIRNNTVRGNGFGVPNPDNAGIKINSSPNVEIYGNTLDRNASGVILYQRAASGPPGPGGPLEISNEYVHDNQIWMSSGYTGLVQTVGDDSYYTTHNNRFQNNTYLLANLTGSNFYWMDGMRDRNAWVGYGQDTTGSFSAR
jgi:parallel beta-helix repeat protein